VGRTVSLLAILALTVSAPTAAGTVKSGPVVLGSKTSFGPYGKGWGTSRPVLLDNDGDPSGHAWKIHWTGWGTAVARGSGLTYALGTKYGGGYRIDRLELRASRIGRCNPSGPVAYTRLEARIAPLRNGRFSAWQPWNERPNVCRPSR
jgi:hypothetical protein